MMEKQKQDQKGYAAPVMLIFILGTISLLIFVVEFGRVIETRSRLNNGVELAVSAGAHAYGKELKKRLDEAYKDAKHDAEDTVQDKIDAGEVDPAEKDQAIKAEIQKIMKKQADKLKQAARDACRTEVEAILVQHELTGVGITCSDTEVEVTATNQYEQQVMGVVQFPSKEFRESSTEDIKITKE